MKKALFVLNDLSQTGSALTALHIIENLPKDVEVTVLVLCCNKEEYLFRKDEYEQKVSSLILMDIPHIYGRKFKLFSFFYLSKIKKEIKNIYKNGAFKFVYLNQANVSGFLAKFVSRKFKVKVIFNSLGKPVLQSTNFYAKFLYNRSLKLTCKFSDYFVGISEQCFPEKYLISGNKILLEDYCEIEFKKGEKKYSSNGSAVIGQIGYFSNNKNQMFTLKLLNKLLANKFDAKVKLLGFSTSNEYFNEMNRFISLNDLREKVSFYNRDYDKKSFLESVDLVVIPSFTEGYPLVIKESLSQKTPVLGSLAIPFESENEGVNRLPLEDFDSWVSFVESEKYKKNINCSKLEEDREKFKDIICNIFI